MRHFAAPVAVFLACFLLLSGPGLAQEVTDALGIFFDESATQTTFQTTTVNQAVPAYLVLKNPSFDDGLTSWECVVDVLTSGTEPYMFWNLNGQGLNMETAPSFRVGLSMPLASDHDVVLASATILVPTAGQEVALFLRAQGEPSLADPPEYGYPVFAPILGHGAQSLSLAGGWANGCAGLPAALINHDTSQEGPQLELPETLNFGFVPSGETRNMRFLATNTGTVAAVGSVALVNGAGVPEGVFTYRQDGGFVTAGPTSFQVLPGQEVEFVLTMAPPADAEYDASLVFTMCGQEQSVSLTGGWQENACEVTNQTLDFGVIPLGGWASRHLVVRNPGEGSLAIHPFLEEPGFSLFGEVGGPIPPFLEPGEETTIGVSFHPPGVGEWDLILDLGSLACPQVRILARVEDLPPVCNQNFTSYDFGEVGVGLSREAHISFINDGGGTLVLDLALEQDGDEFTLSTTHLEMGPWQGQGVDVTFRPEALVARSAVLRVDGLCQDVELSGTGRPLVNSYGTLSSGRLPTVQVGDGDFKYFSVAWNDGEVPVDGHLSLSGTPGLSTTFEGDYTLLPGRVLTVRTEVQPIQAGPVTGVLDLGLPMGETCTITGYAADVLPGPANVLGLHFDAQYLDNTIQTSAEDEVVTGYLVLHSPSTTAGVSAWQLRLAEADYNQAQILGWTVPGGSVYGGDPLMPTVVLDAPLPPAPEILLGRVDILVPTPARNAFTLHPSWEWDTAIRDYPCYQDTGQDHIWIPMDDASDLDFAIINPQQVAVLAPAAPLLEPRGSAVALSWACLEGARGYHIYRRVAGDQPRRLTSAPLQCQAGSVLFTDSPAVAAGTEVFYAASAVFDGGETAAGPETRWIMSAAVPGATRMGAVYPNPFNPATQVPYHLQSAGSARLCVYDLGGRLVRVLVDEAQGQGPHEVTWNGRDARGRLQPSGVYYFRLQTEQGVSMQKGLLLK